MASRDPRYADLAESARVMTAKQLAERYGRTESAIREALNVRGLKAVPAPRPRPLEDKECRRCGKVKRINAFPRNGLTPNGHSWCRACHSEYGTAWHAGRPQAMKEATSLRALDRSLQKNYGITLAEKQRRLALQGNRCPICHAGIALRGSHIDHDHDSGAVRGVLCFACNVSMGRLGDDIGRLSRMIEYLEAAQEVIRHSA